MHVAFHSPKPSFGSFFKVTEMISLSGVVLVGVSTTKKNKKKTIYIYIINHTNYTSTFSCYIENNLIVLHCMLS